ncbi:MAG: AAA family ATPase, partial [Lachnospiraceae bacterium]|nr:AAA family ATPase [Lachnospiraceae bacterium]
MNEEYGFLPLVIVDEMTILPDVLIHFEVTTNYNINAVKKAMAEDNLVVMATRAGNGEPQYGVIAFVRQLMKSSGKIVRVLFDTGERVSIGEVKYEDKSYMALAVQFDEESDINSHEEGAMISTLSDLSKLFSDETGAGNKELEKKIKLTDNIGKLIDLIAMYVPISTEARQKILGEKNIRARYEFLTDCISDEINMQRYKIEYLSKLKNIVDDNQKEYYLREQLNLIHKELGDEDVESEADIFLEKCNNLDAPEEVKKKLGDEIKRFKKLSLVSSEGAVIRGYIETLLDLPWNKKSSDNNNPVNVKDVLEKNHYGLEKVKERIVETLAVRKLTDNSKAPILCLIGPPGTGKTSIVKSVAEALDKKYIRICLGGVKDEAEIRGHRKTYVGAMPGRIITALKRAGVSNPVILLDEIDKVSSDYKGDTHSALLEVLDPEQNKYFTDHYVEVPVDLSDVLFMCTANSAQTIPQPLLDRMEIIEIAGYTANEKFHIAKEHLIGKQRKQNGLKKSMFKMDDGATRKIINAYTREAGVRELERTIGRLCRKVAMQVVSGEKKSAAITERNITKYLGKEKYTPYMANEEDEIGIVRGLAWTR